MKKLITCLFLASPFISFSQNTVTLDINAAADTISPHIYGQFSEHLGRGIYEGIWVGKDAKIPNTNGIRNDVVEALRKLKIPNLRWPGGCQIHCYAQGCDRLMRILFLNH